MTDTTVSIITKNPNYGVDIYTYNYDGDTHELFAPPDVFLSPSEILDDLTNRLSPQDMEDVKQTKFDDLIRWHSDLGMWMRNSYGLWFDENPYTGTNEHADDVSFAIIEKFHERLNNTDPYAHAMSVV